MTNIKELRNKLPTMVIWMAKQAVKEGVKAYRKAEKERAIQDQKKATGEPYSYLMAHTIDESTHVAAEVLYKLFASCVVECLDAIEIVAKNKNGYDGYCGSSNKYFDLFVAALEKVQGYPVRIREKE